jgi:hypothetical protein
MPKKASLLETIALRGLEIAPSQIWGAIRIVPLLRRQVRYDLRLWQRQYRDDAAIISLEGDLKYRIGQRSKDLWLVICWDAN